MHQDSKEFCFGQFRLNLGQRRLFRADERVPLTKTEYELLLTLLEAGGNLVAKEDLYKRVWGERHVEDSNLFQHIRSLRRKLGPPQSGLPYIETVHGSGYRFSAAIVSEAEEVIATAATTSETPPSPPPVPAAITSEFTTSTGSRAERSKLNPWLVAVPILFGVAVTGFIFSPRIKRPKPETPQTSQPLTVVNVPDSPNAPRILRSVKLKSPPSSALLAPGGRELYVSEALGDAISVIDTATLRVTRRIHVRHLPYALALTPDGKKLYVGHRAGGLTVIDTATKLATAVANLTGPVNDVVLTRDGKSAYLALGFSGLAKLDVASDSVMAISKVVYTEALALTPDGRRLYVSYQAGGPGGSPGHDVIGYFDTATDQLAGVVSGKAPNVGGCLAVSPDGSQVWENGGDACSSPRYDHEGCSVVPAGLLNIFGTEPHAHIRSINFRGATMGCITFSPRGGVAVVGTIGHLYFMRSNDFRLLKALPSSSGRAAFTPDGDLAYAPLTPSSEIAVIQMAIPIQAFRLTNRVESDGSFPVAIPNTPDLEAKFIDPATLRIGKEGVKRTAKGLPMASMEVVTGYDGMTLIVSFGTDALKTNPNAILEGTTYSGVPVRGRIASR